MRLPGCVSFGMITKGELKTLAGVSPQPEEATSTTSRAHARPGRWPAWTPCARSSRSSRVSWRNSSQYRPSRRPATPRRPVLRCSGRTTRSRCCCATRASGSSAPRTAGARPPTGRSPRASRGPVARRACRDGSPSRHGRRASSSRGAARRGRDGSPARTDDRAGLPRHLLDDGDPGRRADLALDGDDRKQPRKISPTRSSAVGEGSPHVLLLGIVLFTVMLGQLISNMATALILIPVAISAAAEIDVSPKPLLAAVAVAAAASFVTPVATPANLMVQGRAGIASGTIGSSGCRFSPCSYSSPSSSSPWSGPSEAMVEPAARFVSTGNLGARRLKMGW